MNLFHLLDRGEERLATGDADFTERTATVEAILKAVGALPYRRANLNRELHQLVAASIVAAHEADDTIDITTRRAGTLHQYGYSTKLIEYFDKAVAAELLRSQSHRAEGRLYIGDTIGTYLADA